MGRLSSKMGRPSNYRKGLQSNPYWEKVKAKVKIRDNFKCKVCGSISALEIHHITYYVNGTSIVGKELDNLKWMVTLCETCHDKVHQEKNHIYNPKNPNKKHV